MSTKTKGNRTPLKDLAAKALSIDDRVTACEAVCETARKSAANAISRAEFLANNLEVQTQRIDGLVDLVEARHTSIVALQDRLDALERTPWQRLRDWRRS